MKLSIPSYSGNTYVAFLDISGFKEMMKDKARATNALNKFYTTIYDTYYEMASSSLSSSLRINAIVISDCAVLFISRIDGNHNDVDKIDGLSRMLTFIQKVNRRFIDQSLHISFLTTCSIAYGHFQYEERTEGDHLRKNYFIGSPYINAFLDNESGEPRIKPGECRILKDNLDLTLSANSLFSLLEPTEKHYYFYWMLDNSEDISRFKRKYQNISQSVYTQMIKLLQNYVSKRNIRHR